MRDTVSGSGGQGADVAWTAQLGSMRFGPAMPWLADGRPLEWGTLGRLAHQGFAVSEPAATPACRPRPRSTGLRYDRTEDAARSVAWFGVGIRFVLGVLAGGIRVNRGTGRTRPIDLAASSLAPAISLALATFGASESLLQRTALVMASAS